MRRWRRSGRDLGFSCATVLVTALLAGAGCSSRGGGGAGGAPGSSSTGGAPANGGNGGSASGTGGQTPGTGGANAGTGGAGGVSSGTGGTSPGTGGTVSGAGGTGPDASIDSDGSADGLADHPSCPTSISGTVYDPAGTRPIYNAFVYSPTQPVDPIGPGVTCDRCATTLSGAPAAVTNTDATGHFKLVGLPSGANVPVVIQVGKWRRQIVIPSVAECADTPITANLTRLPRNQSEGHLPKIAVTTGASDALECFVRKLGIDDAEFTTDAGSGRVNLFVGGEPMVGGAGQGTASFAPTSGTPGGLQFPFATTLWGSPAKLATYDMMLLSCEGSQYADAKLPYTANIKAYADAGGRIIAGHLQFYWLRNGPTPWPTTATYLGAGASTADPSNAAVTTTFTRGAALADWLVSVGASATRGSLQLYGTQFSVGGVTVPTLAWMTGADPGPASTRLLTFDTPVEAPNQCGRVAYVDFHVKVTPSTQIGKDSSDPSRPFPTGCQSTILTPQEQALEFMMFDTGACIQ
jgi:hypothetical protein